MPGPGRQDVMKKLSRVRDEGTLETMQCQLHILQIAKSDSKELSDPACVFLVSRSKSGTRTLISQSIDLATNIPYENL